MAISKRFISALVLLVIVLTLSFLLVKYTLNSRKQAALITADSMQGTITAAAEDTIDDALQFDNSLETKAVKIKPEIVKYTVNQGDTLETISNVYGVSISTITESNGISSEALLKVGQELRFPSITGVVYKIKNGETLWDISSTYDVDVEKIAETNGIDSPDKLKIDQEIIIPGVDKIKLTNNESKSNAGSSASAESSASTKLASRGGSSSSSSGSIWPLRGTITSRYGPRWGTTHKGLDIAAPTGTTVSAFMSGTVTFSGWQGGYGNLVIINHGNGLQSYYGHNSKLLVSSGQKVSKGQAISRVGSTGDSTGPHLHFEVRKNGTPVNPSNYLK
jgi:murein DD-endopeptidase MepM/ murein hydrolase activator NlpD